MTLALYMDHNVPRAITTGLQRRGIDVLRAYEDGAHELEDATLLDRAQALGRVLFSRDDDLLREATGVNEKGLHLVVWPINAKCRLVVVRSTFI